jgi:hypothetical protein
VSNHPSLIRQYPADVHTGRESVSMGLEPYLVSARRSWPVDCGLPSRMHSAASSHPYIERCPQPALPTILQTSQIYDWGNDTCPGLLLPFHSFCALCCLSFYCSSLCSQTFISLSSSTLYLPHCGFLSFHFSTLWSLGARIIPGLRLLELSD